MNEFANTAAGQSGVMELINTYREAGLDSVLTELQHALESHPNSTVRRVAGDLLTGKLFAQGANRRGHCPGAAKSAGEKGSLRSG